jgi:hypothetical protein
MGHSNLDMLSPSLASKFSSLVLTHVCREYPNKLDHVLNGLADLRSPRSLHPIFYGSFDWHSNVHGYWLLATLCRRVPTLPELPVIQRLFDAQFTEASVAGELAYLQEPSRAGFERPYGWAWLLMLAAELKRQDTPDSRRWAATLRPLAGHFVQRFKEFLPKATYPIRAGTHFNTAFALSLAFEYATAVGDKSFGDLLRATALGWYANDVDCQAWEPSGDDFLSPALIEAECMRRLMPRADWNAWLERFLPRIAQREPRTLFTPARVSDRTDGKIAHLDGLNLSRAWCWRSLASGWRVDDPRRIAALESANQHMAVSLPHVSGDYAGEHWLATFALLAILASETH